MELSSRLVQCPLLAQSGHFATDLLSGVKQTLPKLTSMSAFDQKRTFSCGAATCHPRRRYDENGVGGFTSDLSTSMFDFFFSFFASFFTVLASFFAFFDPLSCLVIVSPCTLYLLSVFAAAT
jgi:hypothetical protein